MENLSSYVGPVLLWFLAGIFFLLVEITHYGFVSFFFGVGAFIVAIATWSGLTDSISSQVLLFMITSILSILLLRNTLSKTFKGKVSGKLKRDQGLGEISGERAIVLADIDPKSLDGSVEFHGTRWSAHAAEEIPKGTVVEIVERVDLTLKVKRID